MKKLYFLDEEEKQRILNIHESATKRQYLSEQQKPSQAELDKREARWKTDLKCVPAQTNAKPTVRLDKTTSYQIGNIVYYNTGRKAENGKMVDYNCATEFKSSVSTEDKAKKQQEYKQQVVTKTKENTIAIQKLLGLEQNGIMDSALLQKINDKLNGGQQTPSK
jgi:ribosomal protein L17